MKNLILILSVLLLGCDTTESIDKTLSIEQNSRNVATDSNVENTHPSSNNLGNISPDSLPSTHQNNSNAGILETSDTLEYSAQNSLNNILNSSDPREAVYLIHPTKELLVYCYHDVRSECYIEGVHNSQFFKYDISQVEGQNQGKLTSPGNPIDSAKTTPMKWLTVNNEYAQVLMTSKIILNSQQYTLHEPLVIYYETGIMVR